MGLEISKRDLVEGYGLTCIENYFLTLLQHESRDWSYIFYRSYLSLPQIIDEFCENNGRYAFFRRIPRLQKVGEQLGICKLHYLEGYELEEVLSKSDIAAIRVSSEFLLERYESKAWREDHHILIQKSEDGRLHYINDIPQDENNLSLEAAKEIYTGHAIRFEFLDVVFDEKSLVSEFYQSVVRCANTYEEIRFPHETLELDILRDIIGVLRVVIWRTRAFCEKLFASDFLTEYYSFLDMKYARIEYYRLRKKYDPAKLQEMLFAIVQEDSKVRVQLLQELKQIISTT